MKKNNILWYSHNAESHNHWKFKQLRKKYGWGGEGKFWALNNIIAHSNNCLLDISDEGKTESYAHDLDFKAEEFFEFLEFLYNRCKLLKKDGDSYTTEQVQEDLIKANRARELDRLRKLNHNKL